MSKPVLILDCNYVAHRMFHSMGEAMYGEAVIYGFLRDIAILQEEFNSGLIVFAWDVGYGKRRDLFPDYKANRRKDEYTEEEQMAYKDLTTQMRKLREQYLRELGYRNVFFQDGYEADDIIGSVVLHSIKEREAIIVSADQDLWQLLRVNVSCYNPVLKHLLTRDGFVSKWGIEPELWSHVKAIAGCRTDNIPGLTRIGEITAANWYRGKLKPASVAYKKINEDGIEVHNRNIRLTRLPFEGTETFKLKEDELSVDRWNELADRLDMESLKDFVPGVPRGVKQKKKKRSVGFGF